MSHLHIRALDLTDYFTCQLYKYWNLDTFSVFRILGCRWHYFLLYSIYFLIFCIFIRKKNSFFANYIFKTFKIKGFKNFEFSLRIWTTKLKMLKEFLTIPECVSKSSHIYPKFSLIIFNPRTRENRRIQAYQWSKDLRNLFLSIWVQHAAYLRLKLALDSYCYSALERYTCAGMYAVSFMVW